MRADEDHDRLIDILLREELGGERPPDLAQKVLARAFGRRRRLLAWAGLAAAAALLAVLTWQFRGRTYPEPRASGHYLVDMVDGGDAVRRGSRLHTEEAVASLTLGGYCRLDLEPRTELRIEGAKRAEQVYLERGGVACEVDREAGSFAVRTEVGTVSVTGTEFCVQLVEQDAASARRMRVRVLAGAVLVSGAWGDSALAAGDEQCFPEKKPEPAPPSKHPPAKEPDVSPVVGTVKCVDLKARSLVLVAGEGKEAAEVTMRVCPRAAIKVNGKDATLGDVKVGLKARVAFSRAKDGERIAVRIEVRECAPE